MSYEKDEKGIAKLKKGAPKEIKDQYKEHLKHYADYKKNFLKILNELVC